MAAPDDPLRERDLASVLARRIADRPDKPWIVTPEKSYTYAEIGARSGRLAKGMSGLGTAPGETMLSMLPDSIEVVDLWCALARIGIIEVPLNNHYLGEILAYMINDALAREMVIHSQFLDRLVPIAGKLEHLRRLVVTGGGEVPAELRERFDIVSLQDLYADTEWSGAGPRYNDVQAVMYTSGTTGPSKGAMMTHAHVYEYAYGVTEMLELRESDVYFAPIPLFHIAGKFAVVYASCIAGCTAIVQGGFHTDSYWDDIRRHGATVSFLLGAMASFLYRQPEREEDADTPLDRLLMVPLIADVEAFKDRFGCLVSTTWGGTEMNCPTRSGFDLHDNKTCGRVQEDRFEVILVDEDDEEVPHGTPGEALVRAKRPWITSAGYWNHPDWTAKAWRNQWLHTGDMLVRDEAGNFAFVDRVKDAIRRRGENISSMEVEQQVTAHPSVLECAVIPVDSDDTEQEVMAVVVLKPGTAWAPDELAAFLKERLPSFMVPRYLEQAEALPKTQTGKIQKFPLREQGITENTWDRNASSRR
ncbi:AMP-binding protein [Roseovarius indicus]|uniref:AMP-binding protein n=1 Tax=Roseovarius indicus TaxID=540747 RepID=UPI0007D9538B|nr:AMP-binding protein [Roseovarius indicus]OAO06170.1 hypothetical protein A8B76_04130 [Roseovarius indicus]